MATATLVSISAELEAIDAKKAKLRKAFEDLQSHTSLLSPSSSSPSPSSSLGNLKWDDIDSYLTSLRSNLQQKFALLKALKSDQPKAQPVIKPKEKDNSAVPDPVPARPELKSLCGKMDGLGLRNYLLDYPKERTAIRVELADAWKHAPDPAKLVVDAMEEDSDPGRRSRRVAVVLLEELMRAKVEVGDEVKEKAMAIAVEWKRKLAASAGRHGEGEDEGEEEGLEKLCFLHLLAAFGLVESGAFDMNELVEYAVVIARYRQAVELCSAIGFGDKICGEFSVF